jgi:hypothetical protein
MQASRVTISAKTKEALAYKGLDFKKRQQVKRERVYAFLSLQPNHQATISDLIAAAGYRTDDTKQYNSGHAFISTMIKRSLIGNQGERSYKKTWWTIKDLPKVKDIELPQHKPEVPKQPPLLQLAQEYVWTHDSDSLREFIKWLENVKEYPVNGK